ncbi:aspartyl/asparaginyl beta-hydroxylase domain-containing protein [Burkholderia ubonensis]|nr:aspartyl/asparaginyl beta-hydroxylase domain-containing protein [Burkholderia ubonensis]KVO42582.1 hypothetical protein WJ75_04500 [Burkholderia ubonensis]
MLRNDSVGIFPAGVTEAGLDHFIGEIRATRDGQRTFFDCAAFPWVRETERRYAAAREEIDRLMRAIELMPSLEEIQAGQVRLSSDRRWKVFPLYAYGEWCEGNVRRCPRVAEMVRGIDGVTMAMLSILEPNKEIAPHNGNYCGLLRYHLGLKIPQPAGQCGIRVGDEIRHWSDGGSLIFDDTYLHTAWNRSGEDRAILMVDFVRPLPAALANMNHRIIEAIGRSASVSRAAQRWAEWECAYGHLLDERLAAA